MKRFRYLPVALLGLIVIGALAYYLMSRSAGPETKRVPPTGQPASLATPTNSLASVSTPIQATPTTRPAACADFDLYWDQNWPALLDALDQLIAAGQTCTEEPLLGKKYAAHVIYATALEQEGNLESAISHYQAALSIDPHRPEAIQALKRLNALPEPTPPPCLAAAPAKSDPALQPLSPLSEFAAVQEDQIRYQGEPFTIKGVNYYPRSAPWHHFLEAADPAAMAAELDLIEAAGFNTIRIFLRYEALFTCQPEEAIPDEASFAKVDALLQLARERNLKVIVTLNDLPDLLFRPLYTDWAHYDAQTVYIVRRYRHDPNILAWDLRNEGDLDYGARPGDEAAFEQETVIGWLAHTSQLVRENDPHHLLTAGWWGDPTATQPYVDILSFHHWADAEQLRHKIEIYQQQTTRPLVLQEVGYYSWADAPHSAQDEAAQAFLLQQAIQVAQENELSGWLVWTAFDFTPQPGQPENFEHFFGLWRADLTAKPALDGMMNDER